MIINVCRHKCDLERRLMIFSIVPANFVLISQAVLELQQKTILVALEVSLCILDFKKCQSNVAFSTPSNTSNSSNIECRHELSESYSYRAYAST